MKECKRKIKSLAVPKAWRMAHRVLVAPIDAQTILRELYLRATDAAGAKLLSVARLIRESAT